MDIKKFDVERFKDLVVNQTDKDWVDWHSKNTIIFGSLLTDGFDWGSEDWTAYNISDEALTLIRPRLNKKIVDRYFYRELGMLPPAAFKRNIISHLEQAVASQGWIYEELFNGIDFTLTEKEELKRRTQHSEYPQTMLRTEENDYLSNADEEAYDREKTQSAWPRFLEFYREIEEPDKKVVEALEPCFSQILSFNF